MGRGEVRETEVLNVVDYLLCVWLTVGEYMLRDGSDSEDSFSGDDDPPPADVRERAPSGLIPMSQASETITVEQPSTNTAKEEEEEKEEVKEEATDKEQTINKGEGEQEGETEDATEDKGDPEMAPIYLKKMLPVFTELFHSSLAPPLRYSVIGLCTLYVYTVGSN